MLCLNCVYPEKQLFDWGMMRLTRPAYGVGDAFGVESDNHLKKKRDAEAISYFLLLFIIQNLDATSFFFSSNLINQMWEFSSPFIYEWVDSGYVISITGRTGRMKNRLNRNCSNGLELLKMYL